MTGAHAALPGVPACTSGMSSACIAYFDGDNALGQGTATDSSGLFAVLNVAAGMLEVKASATVGSGEVPVGDFTIPTFATTVTRVTLTPLSN